MRVLMLDRPGDAADTSRIGIVAFGVVLPCDLKQVEFFLVGKISDFLDVTLWNNHQMIENTPALKHIVRDAVCDDEHRFILQKYLLRVCLVAIWERTSADTLVGFVMSAIRLSGFAVVMHSFPYGFSLKRSPG